MEKSTVILRSVAGRTARWARRGYELYFQKRIRLQGWWQRMTHSQEGA